MPTKTTTKAGSGKKTLKDLKPAKDAKGGGGRRSQQSSTSKGNSALNRGTKNRN
ncbi:hypothetical protein BH18VER2_BH18VER2_06870 [soil metagenome]